MFHLDYYLHYSLCQINSTWKETDRTYVLSFNAHCKSHEAKQLRHTNTSTVLLLFLSTYVFSFLSDRMESRMKKNKENV